MTIRINKSKLATGMMIAFLVFAFVGKVMRIDFLMIPSFLAAFATMCLGDNNYRVGFTFLLISNIRLFDGLRVSFLVNLLMVMPLVANFLETRRINFTAMIHFLILALWETAHTLAMGKVSFFAANMSAILGVYFTECALTNRNIKLDFADLARKLSFGTIFSSVTMMARFARVGGMQNYFNTYRLTGYGGDANYYSLYLCLGVAMLLIIPGNHKKRDYVYLFTMIGLILMTFSKMSLVILLLLLVYFIGKSIHSILSRKNRFVRRVLMIGVGLTALFSAPLADLIGKTVRRIQEKNGDTIDIDTITSYRITIQGFYFDKIINNPDLLLFGYGLQYNQAPLFETYGHVAHNTLFDIVLAWGLAGVGFFVVIFFSICRRMRKIRTERLTFDHFVPLITLVASFTVLSCLDATMFWWVICAAMLPLKGLRTDEQAAYISDSAGVQRRKIHFRVRRVAGKANLS